MSHRIERVNNLIRQEISELLQHHVKDPRLGSFVTITAVSTTLDLRHTNIFVSRIGSDEEKQETMSGLVAASGFLRNQLAKRLDLRRIPELRFQWDDSIERGARILKLLDEVTTDNISQPGQ